MTPLPSLSAHPRPIAPRRLLQAAALAAALALPTAPATQAWTPDSQLLLAERAVRVAPKDFRKQIDKHIEEFRRGVLSPFRTADQTFHERNLDSGRLHEALAQEVRRTIAMIEAHEPFQNVAFQAGVVTHYVNDLNNPLNCTDADPSEGRYYADYLLYMESTEPRLEYLFYGLSPVLEGGSVEDFVDQRLERCRDIYPLVGKEYRRIGKLPGSRWFDDRSTAFGVSGVAHSRAITDGALVLRHIWISAGGEDWRTAPSEDEGHYYLVNQEPETTEP